MKKRSSYPNAKGFSNAFLQSLSDTFDRPYIGYAYGFAEYIKMPRVSGTYYRRTIARMKARGWIDEAEREGNKFLKLTKKGKLRKFYYQLQGLERPSRKSWGGTWWLALFDIPEHQGAQERHRLRSALKRVGFACLQKSVYIYPYKIPDVLVEYLRISGLNRFVRFFHVDQVDDIKDLRRRCQI